LFEVKRKLEKLFILSSYSSLFALHFSLGIVLTFFYSFCSYKIKETNATLELKSMEQLLYVTEEGWEEKLESKFNSLG